MLRLPVGLATRVDLLLVSEFEVLSHRNCRRIGQCFKRSGVPKRYHAWRRAIHFRSSGQADWTCNGFEVRTLGCTWQVVLVRIAPRKKSKIYAK
ncbi:MAG: hypothetical protein M0R76_13920 [Proteobacteria bacterium]|nr:hypothetical protein [Pseudomonadota bacterium]